MPKIIVILILLSFLIVGCAALDQVVAKVDKSAQAAQNVITAIPDAVPGPNLLTTGLAGLIALLGFYKKYRADAKLQAVMAGVENVKKTINNGSQAEIINDILRTTAAAYNLYPDVKKDLQAFRKSIKT